MNPEDFLDGIGSPFAPLGTAKKTELGAWIHIHHIKSLNKFLKNMNKSIKMLAIGIFITGIIFHILKI